MCGGLTMATSRPNELCHQLSKGAEVTITTPPQQARNAPSGPRNPQTWMEAALAAGLLPQVVERIR